MTRKIHARPFLKWAGGKTQLISEIEKCLPREVSAEKFTYVEPFVGSGAVLFWMLSKFPNLEKVVINDINADLINAYRVIAASPQELIAVLQELQRQYHALPHAEAEKKEYYYQKREIYNARKSDKITHAALFIFLNRTCFNGLYRVNKSNLFNVPMGSYKQPTICDEQNILAVSTTLQNVDIISGDFEDTIALATSTSFFYLDPPYKPLNATSGFNSYAKDEFGDNEQIRLNTFCKRLDELGCKWLLSNSDNQHDDFFARIYNGYFVKRVNALRIINSKPDKRGKISELLINNFKAQGSYTYGK